MIVVTSAVPRYPVCAQDHLTPAVTSAVPRYPVYAQDHLTPAVMCAVPRYPVYARNKHKWREVASLLDICVERNRPEHRFVYQYRTFLVCIKIFHHIDEFNVSFSRVLCAFLEGRKLTQLTLKGYAILSIPL